MNPKYILLILTFIGLNFIAKSQSPPFLWANNSGGNKDDATISVATDANGNVFAGGEITSASVTYGSTILYNSDTSATYPDISIVKYDAAGNVLWARSAGNNFWDEISCITTDISGNVIVTGYFTGPTITFGAFTLTNFNTSPLPLSTREIFIVKYDYNGNVLWARSAGGLNDDYGQSVSTDSSGNVFLTGGYASASITFGTTTFYNADGGSGHHDMYLVCYDSLGNYSWGFSPSTPNSDFGLSVSADQSGNITIGGFFSGGYIAFGTTTLTNASGGTQDFFLVKYLADGSFSWARSSGGADNEIIRNVTTDFDANAFVTGYFSSPSITIGGTTLTNAGAAGTNDSFIAKYDSYGNPLWAKSMSGTGDDSGKRLASDTSGNVIVIGHFSSTTIAFDTTSFTNAGTGTEDVFLSKYTSAGDRLWTTSAGGVGNDFGWAIATNDMNETFVAGFFYSPSMALGTTTLLNNNVSGSTADCFLTKLGLPALSNISTLNHSETNTIIYPNPSTGVFKITSDNSFSSVEVIDMMGKEIFKLNTQDKEINELDLSNKPNGIYIVKLHSKNKTITKRISIIK